MYFSLKQLRSFPLHVNNKTATSYQTTDTSFIPLLRQSRKQLYCPIMALQQHFSHTCRIAEITVYLERRVCIKQIGIGTAFGKFPHFVVARKNTKHVLYNFISMITVEHTCPEVYFPTDTPTCRSVTPLQKCVFSCLKKFGMKPR